MKRTAASKRTTLPRIADFTKDFLKSWERLSHSGRYDLNKLKQVMLLLIANDGPLDAQWKDHELTGNLAGHRECHVGGDFLLVYQIKNKGSASVVIFDDTGTHAELFK